MRVAQLNARQVEFGAGLGQFALQADQFVGRNQVAFTQAFGGAGIGGTLAYIGLALGHLGRTVVGGEAEQQLTLLDRVAFVLIQARHRTADLRTQLDPAPGFDLPLHNVLALHWAGFQPLHFNLGQTLFLHWRIGRGGFLGLEQRAAEQPQHEQQTDGDGDQPGAFGQLTEHGGYSWQWG